VTHVATLIHEIFDVRSANRNALGSPGVVHPLLSWRRPFQRHAQQQGRFTDWSDSAL